MDRFRAKLAMVSLLEKPFPLSPMKTGGLALVLVGVCLCTPGLNCSASAGGGRVTRSCHAAKEWTWSCGLLLPPPSRQPD